MANRREGSRQWRVRFASALLVALATLNACEQVRPPGEGPSGAVSSKPEWLKASDVVVLKVKPSFDDNTEAVLSIRNKGKQPLSVMDLKGRAFLTHGGDRPVPIHGFSLGVAKPIVVAPGEAVETSLLFQGGSGVGSGVRLFDIDFDMPAAAASE